MVHTRTSNQDLLQYDSELVRNLRLLKRQVQERLAANPYPSESETSPIIMAEDGEGQGTNQNNRRQFYNPFQNPNTSPTNISMREYMSPNYEQQQSRIVYPNSQYEIKTGVINLLPTFHGRETDDPNAFLDSHNQICCTLKPTDMSLDQFKLMTFSFTLKDKAKAWLR